MQATNKSDAAQVYEGATKSTKTGTKGTIKYILKPFMIFSYHYFIEGIKAVQKDGTTKELEKITNLSYDETIKVMEKCQKDGVRIVATERKLENENSEFGKKKSLYQQKKITKYARRIKQMSNLKADYPRIAKLIMADRIIKANENKQNEEIEKHKNKHYNIYFNKSRVDYMGNRISDIIEYRTGISKKLFDEDTQKALEEIKKDGMTLNTQKMKDLSEQMKLHEIGTVEISEFKEDYCIHELPFSAYMSLKDDLEATDIKFGFRTVANSDGKEMANIYFQNKFLERYNELGFNNYGQIHVFGKEIKNLQWNIQSQDELVTFKTKTGEEEKTTYSKLSGKNYVMKRQENECVWTILRNDLEDVAITEKKRNVVEEELENLKIFENIEKENDITNDITNDIEIEFDNEKEAGD